MKILDKSISKWILALVVALVSVAVFWPGVSGSYIFDDYSALLGNPAVQMQSLTAPEVSAALHGFTLGGFGRPVAMLSFAFNYLASGGFDPFAFKLTGLVVHALNAALIVFLLERLFAVAGLAARPRLGWAVVLATLWAVHPIQVSSALYVVQRMETLATTFLLLALVMYLAGRQRQIEGRPGWQWIVATVPLLVLGALSKETVVLFPLYVFALEATVLGFAANERATALRWQRFYLAGVVVGALGYFLLFVPNYGSLSPWASRDFDSIDRVLTQFRVVPMYLQQILLPIPSNITFYYDDLTPSRGLLDPWTTLAGLGFLVVLLASAILLRRRVPLYALGVFWFFSAHVLTSNVMNLELMFEHRNYFALLGVLIAIFGLARQLKLPGKSGLPAVVSVLLFVGVGALGTIRAATWGDPLLLATHQVDVNPQSARAKIDLGVIYYGMSNGSPSSPFFSLAMRTFRSASELPGGDVQATTNLILMQAGAGGAVPEQDWDALRHTLVTRPISAQSASAVWALFDNRNQGSGLDRERLFQVVKILLDRREQPAYRYAQIGDFLRNEVGRPQAARGYYLAAVEKDQNQPDLARRIIADLIEVGEYALAGDVGVYAKSIGVRLDSE